MDDTFFNDEIHFQLNNQMPLTSELSNNPQNSFDLPFTINNNPSVSNLTSVHLHYKQTNERLQSLRDQLLSPSTFHSACKELIDWCSDPRAFQPVFEYNLFNCLLIVFKVCTLQNFDIMLGFQLISNCYAHACKLNMRTMPLILNWQKEISNIINARQLSANNLINNANSSNNNNNSNTLSNSSKQYLLGLDSNNNNSLSNSIINNQKLMPVLNTNTPQFNNNNNQFLSNIHNNQMNTAINSETDILNNDLPFDDTTGLFSQFALSQKNLVLSPENELQKLNQLLSSSVIPQGDMGAMNNCFIPSMQSPNIVSNKIEKPNQNELNDKMIQFLDPLSLDGLSGSTLLSSSLLNSNQASIFNQSVQGRTFSPSVTQARNNSQFNNSIAVSSSSFSCPLSSNDNNDSNNDLFDSNNQLSIFGQKHFNNKLTQANNNALQRIVNQQNFTQINSNSLINSKQAISTSKGHSNSLGCSGTKRSGPASNIPSIPSKPDLDNQSFTNIISNINSVSSNSSNNANWQSQQNVPSKPLTNHKRPSTLQYPPASVSNIDVSASLMNKQQTTNPLVNSFINIRPNSTVFNKNAPMNDRSLNLNDFNNKSIASDLSPSIKSNKNDSSNNESRLIFPVNNGIVLVPFRLEHNVSITSHSFYLKPNIFQTLIARPDLDLLFRCYFSKDTTCQINWPQSIVIQVNQTVVACNDPNIEVSENLRLGLKSLLIKNVCNQGKNTIQITATACCCSHTFVLQLVHRPLLENIIHCLLKKRSLSINSSLQKLKDIINKKIACTNDLQGELLYNDGKKQSTSSNKNPNGNNNESIGCSTPESPANDNIDSIQLSMICPITKNLITIPARGSNCNHFRPFDLENYMKHNCERIVWLCPICGSSTLLESLEIDVFLMQIIHKIKKNNISDVIIDHNGNWTPVEANSTRNSSNNDLPYKKHCSSFSENSNSNAKSLVDYEISNKIKSPKSVPSTYTCNKNMDCSLPKASSTNLIPKQIPESDNSISMTSQNESSSIIQYENYIKNSITHCDILSNNLMTDDNLSNFRDCLNIVLKKEEDQGNTEIEDSSSIDQNNLGENSGGSKLALNEIDENANVKSPIGSNVSLNFSTNHNNSKLALDNQTNNCLFNDPSKIIDSSKQIIQLKDENNNDQPDEIEPKDSLLDECSMVNNQLFNYLDNESFGNDNDEILSMFF